MHFQLILSEKCFVCFHVLFISFSYSLRRPTIFFHFLFIFSLSMSFLLFQLKRRRFIHQRWALQTNKNTTWPNWFSFWLHPTYLLPSLSLCLFKAPTDPSSLTSIIRRLASHSSAKCYSWAQAWKNNSCPTDSGCETAKSTWSWKNGFSIGRTVIASQLRKLANSFMQSRAHISPTVI